MVQAVGMRACYLFSRLVKGLRQNLLPLLPNLLVRLQPHLTHIVSTPLPDSTPTKSAQGMPVFPRLCIPGLEGVGSSILLKMIASHLQCALTASQSIILPNYPHISNQNDNVFA